MFELVEFLIEDIDNLLKQLESEKSNPLENQKDLDELEKIAVNLKNTLIEMRDEPSILGYQGLVGLRQGKMRKLVSSMEEIANNDQLSPYTNLISGIRQMVDMFKI